MINVKELRKDNIVRFSCNKDEGFGNTIGIVKKIIDDELFIYWNVPSVSVDLMLMINERYVFPLPISEIDLGIFGLEEGDLKEVEKGEYLYKGKKKVIFAHELQNAMKEDEND